MEVESYGVAHALHGQSWPCDSCVMAPDVLAEESSLSTMLGAHQPVNCVCVNRAEAVRAVDAVLSSPLTLQLAPGDANGRAKIQQSAVSSERCDL